MAFIVEKPSLKDLPPREDVVLVPLRWEVLTLKELQGYPLINPSRWLSGDLARQMQTRLDKEWECFLQTAPGETAEDYSYCFYTTLCPILYWQHIINEALVEFNPETVWIPEYSPKASVALSSDFFADRPKFLTWARYSTLRELTSHNKIHAFSQTPLLPRSYLPSKLEMFLRSSISGKLYLAVRFLKKKVKRVEHLNNRSHKDAAKVYLVSQQSKSLLLRKMLGEAGIPYLFENYQAFEKRLCLSGSASIFKTVSEDKLSPETALARWLLGIIPIHENLEANAVRDTVDQFQVLLHDATHHPAIRALSRKFIEKQKPVAFIPEGAQYPSLKSWPFIRNAWGHSLGETRFALSAGEKNLYEKLGSCFENTIITGYFGVKSVPSQNNPPKNLQLRSRSKRKLLVFVDFPLAINDFGIGRPESSGFEWLPALADLIYHLDSKGFKLVTNGRDLNAAYLLKTHSLGGFDIRHGVPWYKLALKADVVLSVDSSVIPEALNLHKPVVIYHPAWFQQYDNCYSRNYQEVVSDVVRYAQTPEEVLRSIKEFVASPKNDFYKYEYFLAQEQHRAVDWVKEKLAQADSRWSTSVPAARS